MGCVGTLRMQRDEAANPAVGLGSLPGLVQSVDAHHGSFRVQQGRVRLGIVAAQGAQRLMRIALLTMMVMVSMLSLRAWIVMIMILLLFLVLLSCVMVRIMIVMV